jgi:exopolyphosphatase / guanosine-5'-triphosphate,3'-diphosphate pyrophosphatase
MPRYAAVDIGSNSVRMMAADVNGSETRVIAQDRQVTRLGESVFQTGQVSREALEFLTATLARMSATYNRLEIAAVRAVATSAVRDARNQSEFLQRTSAALGTDVEIISGSEEARLIYLGVEAHWPRPKERTLIIDVGGGSAELIITYEGQLIDAVSKPLGAVRLTELFTKKDTPSADDIHRMMAYIDEKLSPFYADHANEKFDRVIATSATAAGIISAANGVARTKRDEADRMGASTGQIRDLFLTLGQSDLASRRKMTGIGPRRAEIIVGGAAVFLRALELFQQRAMYYCTAGVRDGIIADLYARGIGREVSRLSPDQRSIVEEMATQYQVSLPHARHVAFLAFRLFDQLETVHRLPPAAGKILEAAAFLHDVGHFVSATSHHKHSAYLVANSDLPGFTDKERLTIAALCRFHRKSMPQARHPHFQMLNAESKRAVLNLTPLLRLADGLDRGHEQRIKDLTCTVKNGNVTLSLESQQKIDLELWAANKAAEIFREVFGTNLEIQRVKAAKT